MSGCWQGGGSPRSADAAPFVDALAQKIALIHSPWFTAEADELGAAYFSRAGFEVVNHGPATQRSDYGGIHPEQVFDWTVAHAPDSADTVVIGGVGFRAVGAIAVLETELDRPVVSANQASLWQALRLCGIDDQLSQLASCSQSTRGCS